MSGTRHEAAKGEVTMSGDRRPIGYWLKRLDVLIEKTFERTLAEEGTTRREWQVLNTLAEGPSSAADLEPAVDPFLQRTRNRFDTRSRISRRERGSVRLTTTCCA